MERKNKKTIDEKGKAYGLWEVYYDNGNLWHKCTYIHGKCYGYCEGYYNNGKLAYKKYYIK